MVGLVPRLVSFHSSNSATVEKVEGSKKTIVLFFDAILSILGIINRNY